MSTPLMGLIGILVMLAVMLLLKMPAGFAMALVGFVGTGLALSWPASMNLLVTDLWGTFSSYGLTVIPMFVLMGQVCFYARFNERLYDSAYKWLGRARGGLALTTVFACAGFAAICGSNTATAATMTKVALPEMKKHGYAPILSTGALAAGSTLGVLIPPSVVLVVYGLNTGTSIGQLFWGSAVPGVILALLMALTVFVMCLRHPEWGPRGPKTTLRERLRALPNALDMVIVFGVTMGSMALGLFTPSEAGAAGTLVAIVIALLHGTFTLRGFIEAVKDTLKITCMVFVILAGATVFGRFLTVTRLPFVASEWIAALPVSPTLILWAMLAIYAIGGCFMDALAFLLISIPIFFPLAIKLGFDPIWFGVLICIVTTMGAVTPPVGISAYVVAGMAPDVKLSTVFRGIAWFLPTYIVTMLLVEFVPQLVTVFSALSR
jgi:tripartite ATP-independent transporter DctM subunit